MPAALNQNPLLTLDALAHCGCVLPTEVQAALDVSLTLKARELGVQAFLFWGKLNTLSGKDYYVARAYNGTKRVDGKLVVNPGNKFYYSRDGINWLDLEPVSEETTERASKLDCAYAPPSSSLPRLSTRARFRGTPRPLARIRPILESRPPDRLPWPSRLPRLTPPPLDPRRLAHRRPLSRVRGGAARPGAGTQGGSPRGG